jgi:hypothetical protein
MSRADEQNFEYGNIERSVDVTEVPSNVTFKGQRQETPERNYEQESIEVDISDDFLRTPTPPGIRQQQKSLSKAETDSFKDLSFKNQKSIDTKSTSSSRQKTAAALYVNIDNDFESFKLGEFSSNIDDSNLNESYKFKTGGFHDSDSRKNQQSLGDILPQLLSESNRSPTGSFRSFKNDVLYDDRLANERLEAEFEQAISGLDQNCL